MKIKRVALFLPDGVGIKNYLFSNVPVEIIKKGAEFCVIHNINAEAIEESKTNLEIDFPGYQLPFYNEGILEKFYRECATISRLKFNVTITGNQTILSSWNKKPSSTLHKLFYFFVILISSFVFKKYSRILLIEKFYSNRIRRNKYYPEIKSFLNNLNLYSILCSHQRAIKAAPLFEAAKELGIITYTVIYSWDNVPKGRMILKADHYLAWSDYMKNEIQKYYPEIKRNKINITGTPQFEFYRNSKYYISKETFCRQFGLDPNKKIICFSGDDMLTSPFDPEFLRDLCEAIRLLPVELQPQVLFRRTPVDEGVRFEWVLESYREIIKNAPPHWTFGKDISDWALAYPSLKDISLLVNTVRHSDAVVNLGSTMAFDFAMFNKPVHYLNYLPERDNRSIITKYSDGWNNEKIYNLEHFRSMPETSPVYWIKSKDDFQQLVRAPEIYDDTMRESQIQWLDKIVGLSNVEKASAEIANLMLQ